MAVIKTNSSATFMRDAIVLDLGDVAQQADAMRQSAQQQAKRLLDDAQRQAQVQAAELFEKVRAEGRAQGYAEGLEEGKTKGHAEAYEQTRATLETLEKRWAQAAASFENGRDQLEREARQAVLELALKIARKIVHRAIETDPAIVEDQVKAALAHVLRPHDVTIRVNPDDRATLDEALPKLVAQSRHLKHVNLIDDQTVERGGCVVSAGQGQVDARIDTQLARMAELLLPSASAT